MGCLYLASFPNGKCYVGITTQRPGIRFKDHRSEARKPGPGRAFHHALSKYGGAVEFKVLVIANDWDFLCELERRAILAFNTRAPFGYNMTDGGEGTPGIKVAPEVIERRRQGLLGKRWTPEARARWSAKCKGRTPTLEARWKMAEAKRGRVPTNARAVTIDGVHYPSTLAAARALKRDTATIKKLAHHADCE